MVPLHVHLTSSTLRDVVKRLHFPLEIMLVSVRWYAAYPLSLRNLEEMMRRALSSALTPQVRPAVDTGCSSAATGRAACGTRSSITY